MRMRGTCGTFRAAWIALALGIPAASGSAAEVIDAEASVSASRILTGEPFQLRVRVTTDEKTDLPKPRVGGLEPFSVSEGVSHSTRTQTSVINGNVTRTERVVTDFLYTLEAREEGTYTIAPIRFAHGGFDRDLGSAVITVTRAEPGLETRTSVDKRRPWVGEQILYTLRIIPRETVHSINLPEDLRSLIGEKFFFRQLDEQIEPTRAEVDGREARVFDIRIALFPLLAGPVALEGIPVEYRQPRPGRSESRTMFDMIDQAFFGGGGSLITQTTTAAPLEVEARALPSGAPRDFTGSVGRYTLSAALDTTSVKTGDAATLTITIRGNGQPRTITGPMLPDLPHFEVYGPEESGSSAVEGAELWTTRTFRYLLVPSREGVHSLEGIAFPYFDPGSGTYERAVSRPLALRVTPGRADPGRQSAAGPRAITGLGSDIRHIKTGGGNLRDDTLLPHHRTGFHILLALPPLVFAGALLLRRRLDRLRTDTAYSRRLRASSGLRQRLKAARRARENGNARDFYRALSEALIAFPSDKLNLEFRGLTLPEAASRLTGHGASPETAASYDALRQRCDFVLFAGMQPDAGETGRDLAGAESLLARLDKELA